MRKKSYSRSGTIAVIVFLIVAAGYLYFMKGPDTKHYEFLKQPRITNKPSQKMLVVTAQGDPNQVAGKAFELLFKVYYKIEGVPREMPAPRGRWSGDMNAKSSLIGYYGLPVPDTVTSLPSVAEVPGLKVELTAWEYGDVAEILHVGPYDHMTPTIEKLIEFIKQQGYEIAGPHEEEYVAGPGIIFRGDPNKYQTIIRYQVKKRSK